MRKSLNSRSNSLKDKRLLTKNKNKIKVRISYKAPKRFRIKVISNSNKKISRHLNNKILIKMSSSLKIH